MAKTQVSCPNCRQPVVADVEQLFDVNVNPQAKAQLLSGSFNLIQCPMCGYQGNLATPIVYHDPEKELLLTYVPPELGLPRNEQERLIGNQINLVINKLPQEKRKGYLLNPQTTLTLQGLVERILEADGITREMIQAQQRRLSLVQRLANTSDENVLAEIIQQEDKEIDADFFNILNRLMEAAVANGDRQSAQRLTDVQKSLLEHATFGKKLRDQSKEIETALADLQKAGKDLTRDRLLELLIDAPNETRLSALVSFARQAMDYQFFQLLSDRIERARGDGRTRLADLRSQLLQMTQEIDRQIEAHRQQIRQLIEALLGEPDMGAALSQALPAIDEMFVQEVQQMLAEARQSGDLDRSGKLQKIIEVLQKASAPPELELIEEYLNALDEKAMRQFLEDHQDEISPEFTELLGNIMMQVQEGDDKQFAAHVVQANRVALHFSMQRNLRTG